MSLGVKETVVERIRQRVDEGLRNGAVDRGEEKEIRKEDGQVTKRQRHSEAARDTFGVVDDGAGGDDKKHSGGFKDENDNRTDDWASLPRGPGQQSRRQVDQYAQKPSQHPPQPASCCCYVYTA